MKYTIKEYADAGCMQMEDLGIGIALWMYTQGKICYGCPAYNGGNCKSLKKMQRPADPIIKQPAGETVREEAVRRGIGINEVRRQRRDGIKP